jgi:outer membrane protein assembly factor BamA
LTYREGKLGLDWPLAGSWPLRLFGQLSYQQTTNYGYYGLGNASHAERGHARHFYQFDGATAEASLKALERIGPRWSRLAGAGVNGDIIRPYPNSLLAHDQALGVGAEQLHGAQTGARLLFLLGVLYDSRNHETVTTVGQFHEFSLRASPGAFGADPYLGVNLTLRGYVPILGERLSLGARLVGDALSRRAPLFELGRYGGLYGAQGPGGSKGIRGVPQGRLIGRTKLVGNLEARSLFLPFSLASERFTLGAAAFFDAGRVWTDTLRSVRALDGSDRRLHWGVGGGPRLRWGDALLIRADFAYAPLGAELGMAPAVYVDVDQVL